MTEEFSEAERAEIDQVMQQARDLQAVMDIDIKELCERLGHGNVMSSASRLWAKHLVNSGMPSGGEHTVGPCRALMVPCSHEGKGIVGCDWCCGAGLVTKRVFQAMITSMSS